MSRQGARKLIDDFIVLDDEFGNIYKFNKKNHVFYDQDGEEVEIDEGSFFFSETDKYEFDGENLLKIEEEDLEESEDSEEQEPEDIEPEDFELKTEKVKEMKKNLEKPEKSPKNSKNSKTSKEFIAKTVEESMNSFREFENFEDTFNANIRRGKTESQIYFELRRRLTMDIYKKAGVSASAAISFGHLIMTKLKLDVKYSPEIEKVIKKVINNI